MLSSGFAHPSADAHTSCQPVHAVSLPNPLCLCLLLHSILWLTRLSFIVLCGASMLAGTLRAWDLFQCQPCRHAKLSSTCQCGHCLALARNQSILSCIPHKQPDFAADHILHFSGHMCSGQLYLMRPSLWKLEPGTTCSAATK